MALENRYEILNPKVKEDADALLNEPANFDILEKRIDLLTKEYQANILKAVRVFYEK